MIMNFTIKRRLRAEGVLDNGKRVRRDGQTGGRRIGPVSVNSLLFLGQRGANISDKAWMGSSAKLVVLAGFAQAQLAVYGGPDLRSVVGILAVVLPPANRAKFHGVRH
jgi:hypothetical protein